MDIDFSLTLGASFIADQMQTLKPETLVYSQKEIQDALSKLGLKFLPDALEAKGWELNPLPWHISIKQAAKL